jgi:EmrB/QacA subfamily drug resistance transporter
VVEMPRREKLLAFGGILTVTFLTSLNLTVVGTALPRIIAELQGFHLYAWAFTAYSLTSTVSVPIYGKVSDIYGRKRVLLFGILLFSAASALGGFAQTMPQLVLVRALQGLGGGALTSMATSGIGDIFTPRERGRYQGFTGAIFGLSSVVGPLVGGLITDTIGWRWVFFVNVPAALVAFFVILRFFPAKVGASAGRIDLLGTALLVLGVVPLLLALTWGGGTYAWTSAPELALLAAAAVFLTAFVAWQRRAPDPVLDPSLFTDRTFSVSTLSGFLTGAGMFGAIIYLPLFVQGVMSASAAASGFALAPLMLGMVTSSTVAGLVVARTGRYKPLVLGGIVLMVVGFLLASTMSPTTPVVLVVAFSALIGAGAGPTNSLFVLAVQNAFPPQRLGTVTSAAMFFRQMGGTLGVTVFGAIVAASTLAQVQRSLPPELAVLPPSVVADVATPDLLTNPAQLEATREVMTSAAGPAAFEGFVAALRGALAGALDRVFLVTATLSFLALLLATRLPEHELRGDPRREVEPKPAEGRQALASAAEVG